MSELEPEARALAAAEALAERGVAVTARTVREEAQVRMAVASKAAKDWLELQEAAKAIPAAPESITTRIDAIWRDAYLQAQSHFQSDRAGLEARLAQQATEANALTDEINRLEAELESARFETQETQKLLNDSQAESANQRKELRAAETRAAELVTRTATAEATAATLQATLDKALAALVEPKTGSGS